MLKSLGFSAPELHLHGCEPFLKTFIEIWWPPGPNVGRLERSGWYLHLGGGQQGGCCWSLVESRGVLGVSYGNFPWKIGSVLIYLLCVCSVANFSFFFWWVGVGVDLLISTGEGRIFSEYHGFKGRTNQFLGVGSTKIAVVTCWPICIHKLFLYAKLFPSWHHVELSVDVGTKTSFTRCRCCCCTILKGMNFHSRKSMGFLRVFPKIFRWLCFSRLHYFTLFVCGMESSRP